MKFAPISVFFHRGDPLVVEIPQPKLVTKSAHGGPADPFGGTPGGTPKRGTPQGRVPHRVGSAGGTPSRGLPQGVPHRVG